jgi:hypothetical protein
MGDAAQGISVSPRKRETPIRPRSDSGGNVLLAHGRPWIQPLVYRAAGRRPDRATASADARLPSKP